MHAKLIAGIVATLALGGCQSDPADGGSGGSGSSSSSSSASSSSSSSATSSSSGAGGSAPECNGPGYKDDTAGQIIKSVEAVVQDPQGAPVANLQIQLCSISLCLAGTTDANGHVLVRGPGPTQPQRKPAFKYGDAIDYVRLGALVPRVEEYVYPTPFTATRFPSFSEGKPLAPGQATTSNDITVTIPAGAEVTYDTLTFDTPEKLGLRAVEVPIEAARPALDPAIPIDRVFALSPLDTQVCPAATVSVPNTLGWAAGSEVEFFLHGLEGGEEWAPYGGWAKVSDGQVSADGLRIEMAAGGGLPLLGVFGVHLK